MKKIIIIVFLFITNYLVAQEYELINDMYKEKTILRKNYELIDTVYLTPTFFRNNWSSLPSKKTPSIDIFLANFSFTHIIAEAKLVNNSSIDFSNLNKNISELTDVGSNNNNYAVISKPIFNCSKDWVIVYMFNVFSIDVGNTGHIYIYRKVNENWLYFHKINIWIS